MPRRTFIFLIDKPRELHKAMRKEKYLLSRTLHYIINRRINRVDIKIKKDTDNKDKEFEEEYIVIAIDSTGIKVTNRGQWMREKWDVRNKKGYLKIHI
jgi:hypothetical protein